MIQKMFRLTEDQVRKLKSFAKEQGCTESDVIRSYIDNLGIDIQGDIRNDRQNDEIISCLADQLKEKDSQIRRKDAEIGRLLDALVASQEATQAAQALNAAEKRAALALESTAQKEERSRFRRLLDAWRG